MTDLITEFQRCLAEEKHMAQNSQLAYGRDLWEFADFLKERKIFQAEDISHTDIISYLLKLKGEGKSGATVNRKLSSIRAFFTFLKERGQLRTNPAAGIRSPKIERKEIDYLSIEEVETLLNLPDGTARGIRDRALLELLYAAGLRVSEVAAANVEDINLRIGFIMCSGEYGKARVIPLGRPAKAALEAYLYQGRGGLLRGKDGESALFVNYNGQRLTRQGIWKIMREYAAAVGMEHKITPQALRNSFAVHMIQNGADLKSLQELLGHESLSATQIYLAASKNHIKEVYDQAHPRA